MIMKHRTYGTPREGQRCIPAPLHYPESSAFYHL